VIAIDLKGEATIVTGASRGIGRAIALTFAEAGSNLLINYRQDEAGALSLAAEIAALNVEVEVLQGSVAEPAFAESLAATCMSRFGRIDCLVNNAGITRDNYLAFMKEEEWRQVMEVNLDSLFYTSKAVVKRMIAKRKGAIVNLSSISAVTGREGQVNYAAAKAGVLGFTRSLAREVGRYGVRVNAMVTGLVETDMTKKLPKKIVDTILTQTPLGRMARPCEIAQTALFLASGLSSFVTGSCLEVDGGI